MAELSETFQANLERVILSAIIFDSEIFDEVVEELTPSDFFYPSHRHIYEICLQLHMQNNPLDEEFIRNKVDRKIVSDEELIYIFSTNPIASIQGYIKELKEASLKRRLHSLAMLIQEQSQNQDSDVVDILDTIEEKLYGISTESIQSEFRSSKDIVYSAINNIKELKKTENRGITGIGTGFFELDKITTGFNKGDLVIIGARPSMGKTTLFLNMIQEMLKHDYGVAVFSLEMPAEQLMFRMFSSLSSIPLQKIKTGDLDDDEIGNLSECSNRIANQKLFVDDGGNLSIAQLRSKLRKIKKKEDIRVAVIDYLQLMRGNSNRERHLEISEISRGLKVLARELEIPIIALSQLNRSLEARDDKKPLLSDLRESGSIEQDADIILFLYRDEVYHLRDLRTKQAKMSKDGKEQDAKKLSLEIDKILKKEVEDAEIIVAKNRNGETRDVMLQFSKKYTRFENKSLEVERDYTPTKMTDSGDGDEVSMPGMAF